MGLLWGQSESYEAAKPQVSAVTQFFLPGGHVCIVYLQGIWSQVILGVAAISCVTLAKLHNLSELQMHGDKIALTLHGIGETLNELLDEKHFVWYLSQSLNIQKSEYYCD